MKGRLRPRSGEVEDRGRRGALDDPTIPRGGPPPAFAQDVQLRRFRQAVAVVRALTTVIAVVLVSLDGKDDVATIVWLFVLVFYNGFRLLVPLQGDADTVNVVKLMVEVTLVTAAVAFTGAWASPFVFVLLPAVIVSGFGRGIVPALRIGLTIAVTVSVVEVATNVVTGEVWVTNLQWTLFIALVGVMGGYARRILGEARTTHTLTMTRVEHLTDANRLLTSLHSVAQALPASLDLEEVLDTTITRLRTLFPYDAAVILLLDQTDGSWDVARWDGHRLEGALEPTQLPRVLRQVSEERVIRRVGTVPVNAGGGLTPAAESGLYGPMIARGGLTGLIALEASSPNAYTDADADLLRGFLEPASLAIANAQVFDQLRRVGADEERTRIARDLHDRIGQSLAYVAFELDRLVRARERGMDLGPSLERLRDDVRGVIGEVRDTLYDLRTDVSDEQDFATTMTLFLERVSERSGLDIQVRMKPRGRLPLLPERELWRIAQEAVINIERHAHAKHVTITWQTDGTSALLEVADDGVGFPDGPAGRRDSYGIVGMRERAASIGATLQVSGAAGRGTVVRCRLDAG